MTKVTFLEERSKYATAKATVAIKAIPKMEKLRIARMLFQELLLRILDTFEVTNFIPARIIFDGATAPNLGFPLNCYFVSKTKDLF